MRTMKLLPVILAGALMLAACGDDSTTSSTGTTKAESNTTAAPGASNATVSVSDGRLVGPNGHTLYLFEKDQGTTSACTGGCVNVWPALVATGTPTAGTGVDGSKLATADGEQPDQVVYNGHLLYYFAQDQAAGDTNGTKIPSWYAVDKDGNSIEADETSTTAAAGATGY
jgi:predicted lipoprotein with Yx(FWY)xxD motif